MNGPGGPLLILPYHHPRLDPAFSWSLGWLKRRGVMKPTLLGLSSVGTVRARSESRGVLPPPQGFSPPIPRTLTLGLTKR